MQFDILSQNTTSVTLPVPVRRLARTSSIPEFSVEVRDGQTFVPTEYTGFRSPDWPVNPMQAEVAKVVSKPNNLLLQAKTSSGKTTAIVMKGSHHLRAGGRILYLSPIKALTAEKMAEWSEASHPWAPFGIFEITGEYRWTAERVKRAAQAKVLCATPESILSMVTKGSRQGLLDGVTLIVIDEFHTLSDASRGAVLEFTILLTSNYLPDAEIMCSSATVSNIGECHDWLKTLNDKDTDLVTSDYRPVPLETTILPYEGRCNRYSERTRMEETLNFVRHHQGSQGIIAVYKIAFGREIAQMLRREGYEVVEHHSGIRPAERKQAIQDFESGRAQIMVCTSGFLVGVNSPAEYVLVTATEAGGSPIPLYEILQAFGRAGRTGYCERGYAGILVPEGEAWEYEKFLSGGCTIKSTLGSRTLSVLLLSAIYTRKTASHASLDALYRGTLHHIQNGEETSGQEVFRKTLDFLQKAKAIVQNSDGLFSVTRFGKICAQLLISPGEAMDIARVSRTLGIYRWSDDVFATAFLVGTSEEENVSVQLTGSPVTGTVLKFNNSYKSANNGRDMNQVGMLRLQQVLLKLVSPDTDTYHAFAEQAQRDVPRYFTLISRLKQELGWFQDLHILNLISMGSRVQYGVEHNTTQAWIEKVTPAVAIAYADHGLLGPEAVKADPVLAEYVRSNL